MKNPSYKHSLLKKVVCVFLAVLLIFVAGSVIGSAAVFYYVFRRAEYSRVTELEYRDIDAAKYPRESVAFESGKNTLQGYLYVKDNAAGTVIIVNGIFSGADRHLGEIMFFYDHGWQVFAFDGTGVE